MSPDPELGRVLVRQVAAADRGEWLRMREHLWPARPGEHEREIDAFLSGESVEAAVFVAEREAGALGGLLEASIRSHAEGCASSPVAYVEGWWVDEDLRGGRVGAALVDATQRWAASIGLEELASDAELPDAAGQAAHRALGFEEVGRVVCFRKRLEGAAPPSPYDAHPFEASDGAAGPGRCAVCGELEIHIRHHPTRIRAARLLRA